MMCLKQLLLTLSVSLLITAIVADKPCKPRKYNYDTVVCVCNATYCDEISEIERLPPRQFLHYATNKAGLRFERSEGDIHKDHSVVPEWFGGLMRFWTNLIGTSKAKIKINRSQTFQKIIGFGGGFSDSTGYNLKLLSPGTMENALRSYFSKDGIEFNLGRVPIGGTDYSLRYYAYNMYPEDDVKLANFTLEEEDYKYKIPFIKSAQDMATSELYLLASTWSPPLWMKTNNVWHGLTRLKKEYYQTYADYHVKFFEEYEKEGIKFWSVSTTNEPVNGLIFYTTTSCVGWTIDELNYWIGHHFGPTIRNSNYSYLKILTTDDNMVILERWLPAMSQNNESWKYIDLLGGHYYSDYLRGTHFALDFLVENYPNHPFLVTESSAGVNVGNIFFGAAAGWWNRADYFAVEMFAYLMKQTTGWFDWNLVVDSKAGPILNGLPVDAFMIALPHSDEILKQPAFYVMGHFSKFITRGSIRLGFEVLESRILCVSFLRPDGGVVVIIYNQSDMTREVTINDDAVGVMSFLVTPESINTIVYWN